MTRPCPCGSGLDRRALVDAAGVYCAPVCDACEARVRAGYRPEIFAPATPYAASGDERDLDAYLLRECDA